MNRRHGRHLLLHLLLLYSHLPTPSSDEDDVLCLQAIKASLADPRNLLLSWNFTAATTPAAACLFPGITCRNSADKHITAINLHSMSLAGPIPPAIKFCRFAAAINLSGNSLYGNIPPDLCWWFPNLTTLDLSGNSLTGRIPHEIGNCRYLRFLNLASNLFYGKIPAEIAGLGKLEKLNLSDNRLTGEIPVAIAAAFGSAAVFEWNDGLCGRPVSSGCGPGSGKRGEVGMVIAIGVLGGVCAILVVYAVWRFWLFRSLRRGRRAAIFKESLRVS